MLVKFESKSDRVKGLAFHPKRPWLLASLHNGTVQIWDYRMGTLVDKYEEHEGPVRGCAFHPTQPLFITGGDDGKIKVFNYQQRRCLFTLAGHTDYIRTVFFHSQSPWIVSASDDQTVRVWNWQSRTCLAVLTGHSHYVMCAQFHPTEDLIISASLDQTIRMWDVGSLRRKHSSPASSPYEVTSASPRGGGIDLFGAPEGQVKYVLEGHDRGVNWVQFHPTKPLFVSGSDDRSIKLWRYNDSRAWETDTFRGHMNNISSVMFHPHTDLIISNSEDRSIRVWDYNRRGAQPQVFRRESDRFWILASHPELNLIAAGHDSGLLIFKLEHERPAYTIFDESLFILKNGKLLTCELSGQFKESAIASLNEKVTLPATFAFSAADNTILVSSNTDGEYSLIPTRLGSGGAANEPTIRKAKGTFAIFVARNRYALLEPACDTSNNGNANHEASSSSRKVLIKALDNTTFRTIECPEGINRLLPATLGTFFMISPNKVYLYDMQQDTITAEGSNLADVKYAAWSLDGSRLALYGNKIIYIVDRRTLQIITTVKENVNIKSAVWDNRGILFITNSYHLKYVLPNGDVGVFCTVSSPLYLVQVKGSTILAVDRSLAIRTINVDMTEALFKLALINGDKAKVLEMVETGNLIGQSIISYLCQNGCAEIALGFVSEPATRFELAIECCDLDAALESAKTLKSEKTWNRLAEAAMALGNFLIAEECFLNTRDQVKLSFLYLITGNLKKLQEINEIARATNDICTRLQNSICLGDNVDFANTLVEARVPLLAFLACRGAGLDFEAQDILDNHCNDQNTRASISLQSSSNRLLQLEPFLVQSTPWPLTQDAVKTKLLTKLPSRKFDPLSDNQQSSYLETDVDTEDSMTTAMKESTIQIPPDMETGGWGIDDAEELDLADMSSPELDAEFVDVEDGIMPQPGPDPLEPINVHGTCPFNMFAIGNIEKGMQLLKERFGVVNFAPLEPLVVRCAQGSFVEFQDLSGATKFIPVLAAKEGHDTLHPKQFFSVESIEAEVGAALSLTTLGKFTDASKLFENALLSLLFAFDDDCSEDDDVENEKKLKIKELLDTCREYLIGIRFEQIRKESLGKDDGCSLRFACYFTLCRLKDEHLILALRSALTQAYKLQCIALAGRLAKRLLQLGPAENVAIQAKKIVSLAEKLSLNHSDPIQVDMSEGIIDAHEGLMIGDPSNAAYCKYCEAPFSIDLVGQVCSICNISSINNSQ